MVELGCNRLARQGGEVDQFLTVEDVAKRLQIHPETVRRWLREGRLEGILMGRRGGWRIKPESVEKLLAQMAQDVKTAA
jgi:excisionase family DNA binding protein